MHRRQRDAAQHRAVHHERCDLSAERRKRRQRAEKSGDKEHAPKRREIRLRCEVREREADEQAADRVRSERAPRQPRFTVQQKRETVTRPCAEYSAESDGGEG